LHIEAPAPCGGHDLTWFKLAVGESLATFDSTHTDICTQIQVSRKFSLGDCDFKRASAGNGWDSILSGKSYLSPGSRFIRNHPARHRDLKYRHQVKALLQMTRDSRWIVTRIEWTSSGRNVGHSNSLQIVTGMNGTRVLHFAFPPTPTMEPNKLRL